MANTDKVFTGSIPEIYDTILVPLIFQNYAEDMASRVHSFKPTSILETATGSGVVTRALIPLIDSDVSYTASDLNQPMLDRARSQQKKPRTCHMDTS